MNDPRETPANARVAAKGLAEKPSGAVSVEGEWRSARVHATPICRTPNGNRDRELLYGQDFCVLEVHEGWAFGFAGRDCYCGYVPADSLIESSATGHWVSVRQSYALSEPDLKSGKPTLWLSFGSRVSVSERSGDWAQIGAQAWVPDAHLTARSQFLPDIAATAQTLLGTPYLWGGNSSLGLDCSGLVQAVCLAAGQFCPGDSDQQERHVGQPKTGSNLARNDLIFWPGHVAIALDEVQIIHANAHHMAVATEPFEAARQRIKIAGGGDVSSIRRV